MKLLNKDTCQQFKAQQEQNGGESYVLIFLQQEGLWSTQKCTGSRCYKLEYLPSKIFRKLNSKSKELYRRTMHQTQVKRSTSSSETTVASTDENEPNI